MYNRTTPNIPKREIHPDLAVSLPAWIVVFFFFLFGGGGNQLMKAPYHAKFRNKGFYMLALNFTTIYI